MKRSPFSPEGNWYKGGLHIHTTLSDGRSTPAMVAEIYREEGYHFIAITDHGVYGVHEELNTDDFLVFPGVELDCGEIKGRNGFMQHHIVGVGIPGKNRFIHQQRIDTPGEPQEIIDLLLENGNIAFYAHPTWSHTRSAALLALKGLIGLEVLNYGSSLGGVSYGDPVYYDQLLWERKKAFAFATDDSHQWTQDYGGGYIMVKAPALTHEAILESICAGNFYATGGPELLDFYEEDSVIHVTCSPCSHIYMRSDGGLPPFGAKSGEGLTKAEFKVPNGATWVYVSCEDAQGRTAWSNPIWF